MGQILRCLRLSALCSGVACGSALAGDFIDESGYFQELPVVLSASRLLQPISETPNAITVIDRSMIEASGARNIAELFKLVPGMYVGYVDGHTPLVSYHGNTDGFGRRMQVLIDGRTVYLPLFGEVDWAELPLDIGDIERIEVIRGPSAASHGSNSVQGVISIFTNKAGMTPRAQVSANRGDGGISDASVRFGGTGERWDYRATIATRADDGFGDLNDNSSTQLANARFNYRIDANNSLDFQLGYSDTSRRNGIPEPQPTAKDIIKASRDQKVFSDFEHLTWLHTFDENNDIQLSYYHIGRNTKDDRYSVPCTGQCTPSALNLIAPESYLIADDAVIHRHEIELQQTLNTSASNRVVWGAGMRIDSVDSPNNLVGAPTWREYRMFAHDEWRITEKVLLNLGAMLEKNAQGKSRLSPRIAYTHHVTPRHTLRAGMSVAHRNPEMIEEIGWRRFLLGNVMGTQYNSTTFMAAGDLSPERAFSKEIGYIGQLDNAGTTLDIRVYQDRISDIIWLDPVPVPDSVITGYSFKPLFTATYSGLEGTLNYKLGVRSNLTLNYAHQVVSAVAAGLPTYLPPSMFYPFVDDFGNTVPLNSASLLLSHDFSAGMRLGAGFYYQDHVKMLDVGSMQPVTHRLDLRLAKRFGTQATTNGMGGEIALVIQNALGDRYRDYNMDARGERRIWLSAAFEF